MTAINTILDTVMLECGFRAQGTYSTSNSQNEQQAWRLANRSLVMLMRYPWQKLIKQGTITLTSATAYDLPADYLELIHDTMYADTRTWGVEVDTTPETWALIGSSGSGGPTYRTRFYGDQMHVYSPNPGDDITFEYHSKYPVKSNGGTDQAKFLSDTDQWQLDDDLLIMDLVWRFKAVKGMDWQLDASQAATYQKALRKRERPVSTINLIGGEYSFPEPYTPLWMP